ncbi:MAG: ATP-binding cassette domain-containing protein [Verrucomicrobiales bacterium]|nr:ATP-binding cassette domain-containing protein [Verrucomicrobiales bacterium]
MSLFELNSVFLSFDGRPVLEEFSLLIREGEKVVLRGSSGSGKSSLLKLLLGFVEPDQGEVRYRGEKMSPEVAREVRRSVAYVSQAVDWEPGNVDETIREFFSIGATGEVPSASSIREVLERLRLSPEVLDQRIQDLSGGERHRIGVAIGLLLERPVFLLDEPTAALDASLKEAVADRFLNRDDWTVIAAAHDPVWFEEREVTIIDLDS